MEPPDCAVPIGYQAQPMAPMPFDETPGPVNTTPAPALMFGGATDNDTSFPPNANGAVNSDFVMTMCNDLTLITDRTGTNVYSTISTLSWWQALISGVLGAGDVRTVYDPYGGRWIAEADVQPTNTPYVFIAVSQTSDPTGAWWGWKFVTDPGGTNYADYLNLGFNKDKIVDPSAVTNTNNLQRFYRAVWVP
jgi:hypothetical protein